MTHSNPSESLNILLLPEDFYPKKSGGAFIDWNVATHLAEVGDTVTVVAPKNNQTAKLETVDGVEIRRPFNGPTPGTTPNSVKGIFRRMLYMIFIIPYLLHLGRRREFDIVFSTNHLLHPPAALISATFKLSHISFVGYSPSIHDEISLKDPFVLLERINFRCFMGDRVLCQTPSIRKVISRTSKGEVARLDGSVDPEALKNAVKLAGRSERESISKREVQLIFVGRLSKLKNPTELPRLMAQLPKEYSLVMVGDGPQRNAVETAIDENDLNKKVELVGQLAHVEALQAIYEADILLLPSKADAYPAVVFEALSLNTPVLATPVGVLPIINHPDLITAQLDDFHNILPRISYESDGEINEETLQMFSVHKFARQVRNHMLEATAPVPPLSQ